MALRGCGVASTSGAATPPRLGTPPSAPALRRRLTRARSVRCTAAHVRFRPCIDIHEGKVKQIVGSTLRDAAAGGAERPLTNFETDRSAAEYAALYRADALEGGHVVLLSPDPASRAAARAALAAYPGGLQVGGGVTAANAREWLDAGASHVVVTSYVFRDGGLDEERLQELVRAVGASRLVLDLSCRLRQGRYLVVTDRWQRFTQLEVGAEALRRLAASASQFLVHGVDVEGMRLGVDERLVALLGEHSPLPVTYAGGAASLADLEKVAAAGRGRVDVTVGSALDVFGGGLAYADVLAWHRAQAGDEGALQRRSDS